MGKSSRNGPISMAMLNNQRVSPLPTTMVIYSHFLVELDPKGSDFHRNVVWLKWQHGKQAPKHLQRPSPSMVKKPPCRGRRWHPIASHGARGFRGWE